MTSDDVAIKGALYVSIEDIRGPQILKGRMVIAGFMAWWRVSPCQKDVRGDGCDSISDRSRHNSTLHGRHCGLQSSVALIKDNDMRERERKTAYNIAIVQVRHS
jgi:hypothetical protein